MVTGLSQDTVRFYVRKGLLTPQFGTKGGRHAWQVFTLQDVSTARMIRFAQSLGMSLKEIAEIDTDPRRDGGSLERATEILDVQLARLEQKAAELVELTGYLLKTRYDRTRQGGRRTAILDRGLPSLALNRLAMTLRQAIAGQ